MKIEVTQEDIDKGVAEDCSQCPVALAIRRAIRRIGGIEVFSRYVLIDHRDVPLPDAVSEFIEDFDDGRSVSPFSFELDV